jgi:hypothetical protein
MYCKNVSENKAKWEFPWLGRRLVRNTHCCNKNNFGYVQVLSGIVYGVFDTAKDGSGSKVSSL